VLLADENKEYIFDWLDIMDNVSLIIPALLLLIASIKLFGDVDYFDRLETIPFTLHR
jgi:hypothetical protein